ncbi:MAG: hypothetical protein K2M17_03880 [Bacilli bacterium]|nr:hypothetical protein [Bacilli bacterium]
MADNIGQILYKVKVPQDGSIISNPERINIFNDVLSQTGIASIKKLGIQAPPGTICYINDQEIMIGRSGMYELDEVIIVSSLYFVKKQIFILDSAATADQLASSKERMDYLEERRQQQTASLNRSDPEYYKKYIEIQEQFYKEYSVTLELYNEALQGIYIRGGEEDLENIIIDFLY